MFINTTARGKEQLKWCILGFDLWDRPLIIKGNQSLHIYFREEYLNNCEDKMDFHRLLTQNVAKHFNFC